MCKKIWEQFQGRVFPENIMERSQCFTTEETHKMKTGRKQWYYFFVPNWFSQTWTNVLVSYCSLWTWMGQGHPLNLNNIVSQALTFFSLQPLLIELHMLVTSQYENCRSLNKDISDENTIPFGLHFFVKYFKAHPWNTLLLSVHSYIVMWIMTWKHKNIPLFTHFEPFPGIHPCFKRKKKDLPISKANFLKNGVCIGEA